ncbi:MAG: hypothetical protein SFX73_10710 [Kofleriaceae bacterium]|nr:hypothetical protein [Kofleriaceae bacterium]
MAGKRRSGGFRPPELRGTLGTLLRTALQQAGGVRDAIERATNEGRSRIDNFRADRQRNEALAELGEIVLELIRQGEIDIEELPEARELVRYLDELDANSDEADNEALRDIAAAPERQRFDTRRPAPSAASRARGRGGDDDTVGSGARWTPPKPAAPQRVWRPPAEDAPPAGHRHDAGPGDDTPAPRRGVPIPAMPKHPHRKGGISFEDEDDLAEYMHPDDVPPKDRTGGDS